MSQSDFEKKVIIELHDIALSLREISGRNFVDNRSDAEAKTYKEKYFSRTSKDDKQVVDHD